MYRIDYSRCMLPVTIYVDAFFYKLEFYDYYATVIDKCVLLLNCTVLILKVNRRYIAIYVSRANDLLFIRLFTYLTITKYMFIDCTVDFM